MGGSYQAPNMSAANRAAVYSQAETFPILREIEAASRMGTKGSYQMPILDSSGNETGRFKTVNYDYTGKSDADLTRAQQILQNELAPINAAAQLKLAQQYGTQFAQQRKAELAAADPERYKLYDQFLSALQSGKSQLDETAPTAPGYERVGMPTAPQDTGAARDIRSNLERQISSGLAQAGTLDPSMIRAAEQAVRARGAATGNVLGNLSAFREARAVGEAIANADVQRRQQALGLLQSGQTTSDVANRQAQEAFQNILAAKAAMLFAAGVDDDRCSHGELWQLKPEGVSKTTGKPYQAFWASSHKTADGSYCREKPSAKFLASKKSAPAAPKLVPEDTQNLEDLPF